MDSDPGAAGHLPQGVLSQTRVGAVVLRQGVLDVKLSYASRACGVGVPNGLPCGRKHRGLRPGCAQAARMGARGGVR